MLQSNLCGMKNLFLIILVIAFASCTKDRNIIPNNVVPPLDGFTEGTSGIIKLNEFIANGSQNLNEYGSAEDWIELYNTTNTTLKLEAGKWFITDDASVTPEKYALPELTIEPHGFVLIWCDGLDTVVNFIHTNFKLSSSGENIGLFYTKNGSDLEIDSYAYPVQITSAVSNGRYPDGADNWTTFNPPTPEESNQ